jgi:Fanconi-associated nuclease 1
MWPILFQPLKGAFETPYQTAPLDLGEDTFATARRQQVEERLAKMETTKGALEMLRETDDRERDKATWAVGIRWDYGREDLEDIVEVRAW